MKTVLDGVEMAVLHLHTKKIHHKDWFIPDGPCEHEMCRATTRKSCEKTGKACKAYREHIEHPHGKFKVSSIGKFYVPECGKCTDRKSSCENRCLRLKG